VAASRIPVISAVGHETDTTLCDFAADMRVPTPTAAAEAAVPVRAELIGYVEDQGLRQRQAARRAVTGRRDRVRAAGNALPRPLDLLATARQRVDLAATRLGAALSAFQHRKALALARLAPRLSQHALRQSLEREARSFEGTARRLAPAFRRLLAERAQRLEARARLLDSVSYRGVLARGFSLVTTEDGTLIRSAAAVAGGQPIGIEFADASIAAHIDSAFALPPLRQRRRRPKAAEESGQQSLF
jgi:exodeoxyribonuclease VII large subunit